jgi:L,D-transpeptidase ErfK/SrfK
MDQLVEVLFLRNRLSDCMRIEVAVRALFYTPGEMDVKRQCFRGGGKFHAGYFMGKSYSCPIKFLIVLFLNGFLCDNSFLNWNNTVMKRLTLFFFFFSLSSLFSSVQATISPKLQQEMVDAAHPFGQTHFDSAPIEPDQFAQLHSLKKASPYVQESCHFPGMHCVSILPHEIWVDVFPLFPVRKMMMRLNRMNSALFYRNWLLVPNDWHQLHDWDFSPMPLYRNTSHQAEVVVDLKKHAFGAYDARGRLLRWGPIASGRKVCLVRKHRSCATRRGAFTVFKKKGVECYSRTYPLKTKGGAPMPYCMFFDGGRAMHASRLMGYVNQSRGCVGMFLEDAKWLSNRFVYLKTKVLVI